MATLYFYVRLIDLYRTYRGLGYGRRIAFSFALEFARARR
jgi:hypothetical protein